MYYYIIENRIRKFALPFDESLYNYPQLTNSQALFYENNPNASLNEVLSETLNPIYVPTLIELKEVAINHFSQLAFEYRENIYPEYKLINASLGIYDETETNKIKQVVNDFRTEFYRLKTLVDSANNENELNEITHNYENIG